MIAALACLAVASRPPVVLVPDLDSETVTVQALVKLPVLSDAERLCVLVAWDTLLQGSEEYSRVTLRGYGQQAGRTVVTRALGDHLYLRLSLPKAQLATGAAMLESLVRRPLLLAEDLEAALARRLESPNDPWAAALDPEGWREAKPNRNEIVAVFRKVVRPENTVFAIGGDVDPAAASRAMARFDDWSFRGGSAFVREWAAAKRPLMRSPGKVTTFELAGPERSATPSGIAVELMATVALGVGKGSALQRVAREEQGWSYRQEGFLQPTPGGQRLRLLWARGGGGEPSPQLDAVRESLKAEVKSWTMADRQRALGMLKAWLEHDIGVTPIRLLPEGRPVASLEERTHLRAWWRMKFGADLSEAELIRQAENAKLEDIQALALEWVEKASGRFLIGGP